jgi:transposase
MLLAWPTDSTHNWSWVRRRADKMQLVRRTMPPTPAAAQLRGFIQHRYELSQQSTQLRNKLTAICDEIFPELTQIFHDPNREVALAFRETFPTPHEVATASLAALREHRHRNFPSEANLLRLQQLARETIGITSVDRLRGLKVEQELLIKEVRLVQEHLELMDRQIADIVKTCREGQILLSMPPIGPVQAATIIATVGNIANFEKASELKCYFGWAPRQDQTGVSFDRTKLARRGVRPMKHMLYLMAVRSVTLDCEWAKIYQRLLPRMGTYDERTKDYRGKKKVLGRLAGQMASMIYALLKTDQETLSLVPPGQEPPPPIQYDPEVHRRHQQGHYRSLKPGIQPRKILHLPKQT